jgi:hypothetical protein
VTSSIVRVTRGDAVEVYRVQLLADGAASLERFEDGVFGPPRVFRGAALAAPAAGADGSAAAGAERAALDRAIRHISAYLNGAVTVGERDLLSPASALTRNVRWFPGDLQMLESSLGYVRELFPSAQFHVTQLLRRVFGDIAFIAVIAYSSLFWLRSDAPVARSSLSSLLLVVSMLAIVGLDAYIQPIRLMWRNLGQVAWRGGGARRWVALPRLLLTGLGRGTLAVALNTLIGLSNLVIHPAKILQARAAVKQGKSLEWKASSASAAQDVRGWPLAEFVDTYRAPFLVGLGLLAFSLWLIALGAPLGVLGLTGLGVFIAAFLTAGLYAWFSALPRRQSDGAPRYRIPSQELLRLAGFGSVGLLGSALLWRAGLYPLPAFEGSLGLLAAFLTASAFFALTYPLYHRLELVRSGRSEASRGHRRASAWVALGLVGLGSLGLCGASTRSPSGSSPELFLSGLLSPSALGASALAALQRASTTGAARAVHQDEADWRMPETERRVYEGVQRDMRRQAHADPDPLLRSEAAQPSLAALDSVRTPDLREPRGVVGPKLPRITLAHAGGDLPELSPLPPERRLPLVKPARELGTSELTPGPEAPLGREDGRERLLAARRRALALTPRALSPDELRAQRELIERAEYPWLDRDELRRLGQATDDGVSVPLLEMARAERWDEVRALWDRVEAAARGGVPDRTRLFRLREGVEGAIALGHAPSADHVQRFLSTELDLIASWSRDYPSIPLSALSETATAGNGRFFEVTRYLLEQGMSRVELERLWRLDYVNAFWDDPSEGAALHSVFQGRARRESWERIELDWEGNEGLRRRWEELGTERAVAMQIWSTAGSDAPAPSPRELRSTVELLDRVLGRVLEPASGVDSPYAALADLFRLDGVDSRARASGDTVAALLASRVWTRAMAGRLARIVAKSAAGEELFGTEGDRALIREVARQRFPNDAGDPLLRRVFDWLVLVDGAQTYRELAAGYDEFVRDAADLGLRAPGLPHAPRLADEQLFRDLLLLWRELPRRYPMIPARDDMVAEFLCQAAYFSSRDGRTPRAPLELLDDFAGALAAVDAKMAEPPPPAIQKLSDLHFESTQGKTSRSAAARRFFAWWMVAMQAEVVAHDGARRGIGRHADLSAVARDWAAVLDEGAARHPHLPWFQPGFAEYYATLMPALGVGHGELFRRFGQELGDADQLMARHVIPFQTFESVVDRRIQAQTGSVNFDATLRRANALVALAQLCRALEANGLSDCRGNPALVTEKFSLLYERLRHDYPALDWDSEGLVEFYLLTQLRQGWGLEQVLARFDADWSLANALAGRGWLRRLNGLAAAIGSTPPERDASLARFMEIQVERLEKKTGARVRTAGARAMDALLALASLLESAAEEGLLPVQGGAAWSKPQVRAWALGLAGGPLDAATSEWGEALLADWSALLASLQQAGPRFPWLEGSILEANLLAMRSARATVSDMREGFGATWQAASELFERQYAPPPAFERLVHADALDALRRALAAARAVPPSRIADSELAPEDPALIPLEATLALADVVATVRRQHHTEPDPDALAARIVDARQLGPTLYASLPWHEKGFVPALVVAAERADFAGDFWKYPRLVGFREVDRVLGELSARRRPLPDEVLVDVRDALYRETGRSQRPEALVALQAVQDGVALLREFLPELALDLDHVLAITRLRARLRGLAERYSEIGIVRSTDGPGMRRGFAERLAALAMKRALAAGVSSDDPAFVERSVALVEDQFLQQMQQIYAAVKASLSSEEVDYYRRTIADEARSDNSARAARFGLSPASLSVPDVELDDVVADAALYEILYAKEIGQDARYLVTLFDIVGKIQSRPATRAAYRRGLEHIDALYGQAAGVAAAGVAAAGVAAAGGGAAAGAAPAVAAIGRGPGYRRWWAERGELIRASRGKVIGLARTFALVKRAAFEPEAAPDARAAFARFGSFDEYLDEVLDSYDAVADVPELAAALSELRAEDPHLSDGLQFALALLDRHVLERLYPGPGEAQRVLAGIAAELPAVVRDELRVLGFAPRLESGVALYDARRAFLRAELQSDSARVLYRLELLQRGVQRWSQTHLLQQAYEVLFHRDLDLDDPTPCPASGRLGAWLGLSPLLERWLGPALEQTRGQVVSDFLERRLPARLEASTGVRDLGVWLRWLQEHGELGLDGEPTGNNPYATEVAQYEQRIAHYAELIEAGNKAGRSVRAERQRSRDVEKEYASYRRQVAWLQQSVSAHARLSARARRDYGEALVLHAFLPLFALLIGRRAARVSGARRPGGRRLKSAARALALWLPLALAIGVPAWVASDPGRAAAVAERSLTGLRLLGRDAEGRLEPRGAAAQLARLEPWQAWQREPRQP